MLTACDSNGNPVVLIGPNAREIARQLKNIPLFCPQCKSPVAVKAGSINIPHFAHISSLNCASFSESESLRHLTGKTDLYNWISGKAAARLEACLPGSLQRPDILTGNVAVEFQCSVISLDLFTERTENYIKRSLNPFWIYGGPQIERKGAWLKFNSFHRLFFRWHDKLGFHMTCYNPDQKVFVLYTNIVPVTPSCCTAKQQIIPLKDMLFPPEAAVEPAVFPLADMVREQKRWISMSLRHAQSRHHPFFKAVYEGGHQVQLLPEIIGLPILSSAVFRHHPAEWQFYIWLDRNCRAPEEAIYRRLQQGYLKKQQLPLAAGFSIEQAVKEYSEIIQRIDLSYHKPSFSLHEKETKEKSFCEEYSALWAEKRMF